MSILVFDSGIGGLSVLREARVLMGDHQFIYVGDNAAFPYGDWEGEALSARIVNIFEGLIEKFHPKMAIIACNTASTLILPALRARFNIPFVGTVPAIKPAAERTYSGMISVLATPGTVRRDYTKKLIGDFAREVDVRLVGANHLAQLAEDYMMGREIDKSLVLNEILPCFKEMDGKRTDIIVLACTHYPFLANVMRSIAPWPVDWLNPAEAIARHGLSLLQDGKLQDENFHKKELQGQNTPANHDEFEDLALMTKPVEERAMQRLLIGFGLKIQKMS